MHRALVPALVLTLVLASLGCADPGRVWRQRGRTTLDLAGSRLLVLPVHVRLPGDRARLDAALFGALSAALGPSAVSLQPVEHGLKELGLEYLYAELARGLVWAAWHGGAFGGEFDELPGKLHTLLQKAPALLNQPNLQVDYVLAVDVFRTGGVDEEIRYKAVGGVYDPDDRVIRVAVEVERAVPERHLAVALGHLGRELVARMVGSRLPEEPDWDDLDDRLEDGKPPPELETAPIEAPGSPTGDGDTAEDPPPPAEEEAPATPPASDGATEPPPSGAVP